MKLLKALTILSPLAVVPAAGGAQPNPVVKLTTSEGEIELELDAAKAPKSVENFLAYVQSGFYEGTIFHRVIKGFMIQGGGMTPGINAKATRAAVENEADNGLTNLKGTIAMARTNDPHSATAQFFINTADNPRLDHRGKNPAGWGYAVFGRVTRGMETVLKIENAATGSHGTHEDVPVDDIVLQSAVVVQ